MYQNLTSSYYSQSCKYLKKEHLQYLDMSLFSQHTFPDIRRHTANSDKIIMCMHIYYSILKRQPNTKRYQH